MMKIYESGPPAAKTILFLHGANTGAWMWRSVIDSLENYRCIAVDLPGHGNSSQLDWISFEETARQVAAIIQKKAQSSQVAIVGISLGGYIALHLLAIIPEHIDTVMISGIQAKPIPHRRLMSAMGWAMRPFLHSDWLLEMNAKSLNMPPPALTEYVEQAKKNNRQAFTTINQQALDFVPPKAGLQSPCRKLFVAGEKEHPTILESLTVFQQQSLKAQCYTVSNVGHGWSNEKPQLFAHTLDCWIHQRPLPQALDSASKQSAECLS